MMGVKVTKAQKRYKIRWHKQYNRVHKYATKETEGKKYSWAEMYLIWNKKLEGGKIITDVKIAKVLKRSLQGIQLKRHKMKAGEY